ncbi:WD repeat-containing protein 97 [Leptodactylus fuscus]
MRLVDDEGSCFLFFQMRQADFKPSVLVHGVQLLRRVPMPVPLLFAAHISEKKRLVSVDCAGTLRLHYEDGRLCSSRQLGCLVSGLLYASQLQQYVAWNHQELLLFDSSFISLSRTSVQQGVSVCIYYADSSLVLSAGCGGVIVWSFGHSRRNLVRQQSLSQGMTDEDKVTALAVSITSPHGHTCYAACGTSVWEYDLSDGTLRRVRTHLHARDISSLMYCERRHLLISGARDGSIKVWDRAAQLVAVYVGHTGPVVALSLTSSGTVLVSGSEDASLRTWDLTTQEQMEERRVSGSLLGLNAFSSCGDHILSYSSYELQVWQAHHVYQLHCPLGKAVTEMTVNEEVLPSRVLCVCADGSVQLISSSTGELLAALDGGDRLLGAAYCTLQGTVCALLGNGRLLKASALTNPMDVVSRVKVSSPHSLPCCFSFFSCLVDSQAEVAHGKSTSKPQQNGEQSGTKHRLFYIIGSDDGHLRVYNWSSDTVQCESEAHSPGRVTHLMSIPEKNSIITAGSDLTVKVWRFYPFSAESLSLCMSFYCAQPVGRLCALNSLLFVAFHDSSSATHALVQYCLKTGTRSDHPPNHDHQDQITGLCASPGLGLVASCGRDKVIRLWTEENRLLRLLCLNASPEGLSFCSSRAELFVGIQGHIYRISLMKFLPQPYKLKVLCMSSPASVPLCPEIESSLFSVSMEDMTELTLPAGLMHGSSVDSLHDSVGGLHEPEEKIVQKEEEFLLLSSRDRELHLIQMGKLRSQKKMKRPDKETRREAMKNYFQLIYQEKSGISIPDQDDFDAQELLRASGIQEPNKVPFVPLKRDWGFFTDSALGFSMDALPKHFQSPPLGPGSKL